MNLRILAIELRRSVAPWAGAVVLATALAYLYLIPGPWWNGLVLWTAQWTSLALWTRALLVILWPLAVGFGALQGLRDRRSKMSELLASTPRPARHRAAAMAGTAALTLASAFGLLVLVGAVQVLGTAGYTHLGWLPISLVGALSLVAGAALGMGTARALPSALTPPALTVGAFLFTNTLGGSSGSAVPTAAVPNRLSLLSPAVAEVRDVFLTISGAVHLGQTLWLSGMLATGLALLAAATPRTRLLALTPLLAGAALAMLVLPSDPRATYVTDEAAAAQVCDGPVCVARAHQQRLADLAGPGRKALSLLHGALGGQAPVAIHETTAARALGDPPQRPGRAMLVDFGDGMIATAKGDDLTRALLAQGMAPTCYARSDNESGALTEIAAQSIAAGWVLGDLEPLRGTVHRVDDQTELARPVWKRLMALPRAEQLSRITSAHAAAVSCEGDPLDTLNGGPAR